MTYTKGEITQYPTSAVGRSTVMQEWVFRDYVHD